MSMSIETNRHAANQDQHLDSLQSLFSDIDWSEVFTIEDIEDCALTGFEEQGRIKLAAKISDFWETAKEMDNE